MVLPYNLNESHREVDIVLRNFYLAIEKMEQDKIYDMLSPNMQRFALLEQHSKKFQIAFNTGRRLHSLDLFSLKQVKELLLEAVVILCLVPNHSPYKVKDIGCSVFKIQLIHIDKDWLIDDIVPYTEFWDNEYKDVRQGLMN